MKDLLESVAIAAVVIFICFGVVLAFVGLDALTDGGDFGRNVDLSFADGQIEPAVYIFSENDFDSGLNQYIKDPVWNGEYFEFSDFSGGRWMFRYSEGSFDAWTWTGDDLPDGKFEVFDINKKWVVVKHSSGWEIPPINLNSLLK